MLTKKELTSKTRKWLEQNVLPSQREKLACSSLQFPTYFDTSCGGVIVDINEVYCKRYTESEGE